jgi:hypothetical protein
MEEPKSCGEVTGLEVAEKVSAGDELREVLSSTPIIFGNLTAASHGDVMLVIKEPNE